MKILTINTCFSATYLGVINENQKFELYDKSFVQHSVSLFDNIEKILKLSTLNIKDCDAIGVVIGPGSFTGIRIGISVVKGLAYALNLPIISINSFELMGIESKSKPQDYVIIKGVANEIFVNHNNEMKLMEFDELKLKLTKDDRVVTLKDDELIDFNCEKIELELTCKSLNDIAYNKFSNNELITPIKLEPCYLRLSQAEKAFNIKNDKLEKIFKLEKECFLNYNMYSKDELQNMLNNSKYELFEKFNELDNLIAFALILKNVDFVELMQIAVNDEYRRKGYAKALIIEIAKKFNKILLEVSENNKEAINLYKTLGFKIDGIRKHYYNDKSNCILMTLCYK